VKTKEVFMRYLKQNDPAIAALVEKEAERQAIPEK